MLCRKAEEIDCLTDLGMEWVSRCAN